MKLLLTQTNIIWQSPEANRGHIDKLIKDATADLIILPEMFTTGFCMSPKKIAEPSCGETFDWMHDVAKAKNAAMAGSIATKENGRFFNRFYFVHPNGSYTAYDKRHLFSFAGEHKEYEAGRERVIVKYRGFRILLQVCYDLRFPVFSRNRNDYDMIIYVANWPVQRIDAWNILLKARAIENACYVAGVNRVGNDTHCNYNGSSVLLDYMGKEIASTICEKEETVFVEIEKESLIAFRKKFPVLDDADSPSLTYPKGRS